MHAENMSSRFGFSSCS